MQYKLYQVDGLNRIIYFAVLIIPSIILLSSSYEKSINNNNMVNLGISNIIKINRICTNTILMYHELVINQIFQNKFIAKNRNVFDFIDQEITDLSESISSNQNISPEIHQMLSENICPYYRNLGLGPCEQLLKGVALLGTRATVISIINTFREERDFTKNKTYTVSFVLSLLLRPYRGEIFLLTTSIMLPASMVFVNRLSDTMLANLEDNAGEIGGQMFIGLFLGVLGFSCMIYIIYGVLKRERRKVANTLDLVPLDFVVVNNHFKMYLIKENKDFIRLFKNNEWMQKIKGKK